MVLTRLLDGVRVTKMFSLTYGKMVQTQDVSVRSIQYDSRKVGRDDMFVAIRGAATDGHRYIEAAINNGATVVVVEDDAASPDSLFMHSGVVKLVVPDSRKALALLSGNFYGHPSRRIQLVGVTGTNGKTTTTHVIRAILEEAGYRTGLIGTIDYRIGGETHQATHTTPESLELNALLNEMIHKGCRATVMEVSSHSLVQRRVYGLEFQVGVFTNLTQDHLDFHGTMDRYFSAKRMLFSDLSEKAFAITNLDDPRGEAIVEGTRARRLTYGIRPGADVAAENVTMSLAGMQFSVDRGGERHLVESSLTGKFNVSNILAAYTTGFALEIPEEIIRAGVKKLGAVRGRFEQVIAPQGWTAVIDYAHTPDALEHCLRAIRELLPHEGEHRIITLFGCGGNRDRGKRPVMGRIATTLSDITIVTSDNPRREDPDGIIREIMTGVVPGKTVLTEPDRRQAIRDALKLARPGDVVLVAGKGHEDYQVIGEHKVHLDDREEVENYIRDAR